MWGEWGFVEWSKKYFKREKGNENGRKHSKWIELCWNSSEKSYIYWSFLLKSVKNPLKLLVVAVIKPVWKKFA